MRKKTVEELRAANAARQKKWREKHRWLARQRQLACYGKAKGQQKEEVEQKVVNEQETYNEGGPEYDQRADREIGVAAGGVERMRRGEAGVGRIRRVDGAQGAISDSGVGVGEDTGGLEEAGTVRERFEALKRRYGAVVEDPGVEVEFKF